MIQDFESNTVTTIMRDSGWVMSHVGLVVRAELEAAISRFWKGVDSSPDCMFLVGTCPLSNYDSFINKPPSSMSLAHPSDQEYR